MPDTSGDRAEATFTANLETIRTAAKWLVAAFAALGTVLVAGSQLSSIGSLDTSGSRFYTAIAGMAIALLSVLAMVALTVRLLLPRRITVDDLVRMESGGRRTAAIRWFDANPSYRPYDSFAEMQRAWTAVADQNDGDRPDFQLLTDATRKVQRLAVMAEITAAFRRTAWAIAVASVLAAGGIATFAWAANPPSADDAPASLRNLDLSGVDLRGANLQDADLVGVDFTRADLEGATLRDAAVDSVLWSNTTCPDGTNSRDHVGARGDEDGIETCEGHLVP